MATKLASWWKNLGRFALNKKKLAASRVRRDRCRGIKSDVRRGKWSFGMHGAEFNRGQTKGFLKENIVGHAKVDIEELRCTGGAGETTTPTE